jgi:hypothetical protein
VDRKGRTPISVDPTRVDCTEHFIDAFKSQHPDVQEDMPAGTKIIMKGGKKEYFVQGTHEDVVAKLNLGINY